MSKKNYIYLLIFGSFILFILLPIFNYTVDRWRILHSDYKHYYRTEIPNKTFLKTKYLCEHPKDAKNILLGSSNGGYINANFIAPHTYNMKYNFGLLAIHLHNIKVLLKNHIKIDTLWVGLNDYIIWKDPKDYYNSFERSPYNDDFFEDLKTYAFYLFRKPDMKDWYLFNGNYRLIDKDLIINPQPHLEAQKREIAHSKVPNKWKKHINSLQATLLHYDDITYRIDEAISEIKQLKELCLKNNITLKIFTYPVFYKSYLAYNQNKIEIFKSKLAEITDFYDFYQLNDNAFNPMKWQDSMHFSYSMGTNIIQNIKKNKHLVGTKNIKEHLKKIKDEAKKNILTYKPSKIFSLHPSLSYIATHKLFSIYNKNLYTKNNDFYFESKKNYLSMHVNQDDPILILNDIKTNAQKVFIYLDIDAPRKTYFELFYKASNKDLYTRERLYRTLIKKGRHQYLIAVPSKYIHFTPRIDLVDNKGLYKIYALDILE